MKLEDMKDLAMSLIVLLTIVILVALIFTAWGMAIMWILGAI
jgi:hypothetical protein